MNTRRPTAKSTARIIRQLAYLVESGDVAVHGIVADAINDSPAVPGALNSWKWTIEFSRMRCRRQA
jgi:hypothetical protein